MCRKDLRKSILMVLVVWLWGAAAHGQVSLTSLLLRVASLERVSVSGSIELWPQEALIFRDGLVVVTLRDPHDESCSILRGTISKQAMNGLQQVLRENKIGLQQGNCFLPEVVTGALGGDYITTWFGKGSRQNTFEVGEHFVDGCPSSTLAIIDRIRVLLAAQRSAPGSTVMQTTCRHPGSPG
jgi:hypothetical protein